MQKCITRRWNINEATISNWSTEGRIDLGSYSHFRFQLALSLLGLAWFNLFIEVEKRSYDPSRLAYVKPYYCWEFRIGLFKGAGIKVFFSNIWGYIKNGIKITESNDGKGFTSHYKALYRRR
jgi:hypothetical protein